VRVQRRAQLALERSQPVDDVLGAERRIHAGIFARDPFADSVSS
jgi:hypothetical protein